MRGLRSLATLTASLATISEAHSLDNFVSPPNTYRPKFRYWLPDAEVDIEAVTRDVAEIASVGAGGLEFLPYYQFRAPSANWSTYGYGTNASRNIFRAAMQAAAENDLLFDFAIGANQGQGVPSEPESVGLALELAYVNITVAPGHVFNGTLPLSTQPASPSLHFFMHPCEEFGQQNLSFVLAVEETSVSNASSTAINLGRVIDITTLVDPATRSISWMSPKDSQSTWRLMAWYTRYTNQRSIDGAPDAATWVQNGSWVTDHFSAAGAKKLTGFFDEYMIPEEQDRELLVRVGKYAWEDSMETVTALWWTHNFADAFRAQRGYDITPCLPFLIQLDNYWAAQNLPYGESFLSQDNSTLVSRCNDDYRLTLQAGYEDYILTTSEWAHKRGLKYSNQPAYNLPLNMLDSIPLVDAPEGESLGFDESPSLYRHLSGPAHMARNPVVSSEAGAVNGAGYTQTIADLLRIVRRGLAGGISMNVLHGYAYSGTYAQTTWPGYTVFAYTFTDMWGPRMPAWRGSSQHVGGKGDNDTSDGFMADAMAYVARNQFISQVGTARVDLAFYQYAAPFDKVVYESDNLEKMGFTYDYLGPASFSSQHAAVNEKGILAPDGPAYKALIFANQTKLTLEMAMQTRTFAEAGLPIFVIGSADFQSSAEEVPAALAALNIQPRVLFLEGGEVEKWYSFSRSTDDAEVVFLYNDGETSTTTNVSILDMEGRSPHVLDAWTGSASPLLQYTVEENNVVVPMTLAANQTAILVFSNQTSFSDDEHNTSFLPRPPSTHITSTSGPLEALLYTTFQDPNTNATASNNRVTAHLGLGTTTLTLATGQILTFTTSQLPEATTLDVWNITVNDWRGSNNSLCMETAVTPYRFPNSPLAPWKDLDPVNLSNTSGTATYETTFRTPSSSTAAQRLGAHLHLGAIIDAMTLWVNDERIILDVNSSPDVVVDITSYLNPSEGADNVVLVEVASTLYNRVRPEQDSIMTSGGAASRAGASYFEAHPAEEYVLKGPVSVQWVKVVDIL
ncbi:secreted protein [Colletotrichum scovillei]|nr:secreted protein [Colletotrichum scovillei]KAG7083131.1 secreted protein [Colletotrichum scovillei]